MKRLLALTLAVSLTTTPAMAVSLASCTTGASSVSFGTYDPLSGTPLVSAGSVNVSCSLILGFSLFVGYTIALSPGSGSYITRTMHSGGSTMIYNMYTTAAFGSVWGDGSAGTTLVADGYLLGLGGGLKNYPIFSRVPALQPLPAGMYSDSIVVTVSY